MKSRPETRIADLRKKYGMNQSELADLLGITRASVNAWDMGLSLPRIEYLLKLRDIFHVSIDYMLGIDDEREILDLTELKEEEKEAIYKLYKLFSVRNKE